MFLDLDSGKLYIFLVGLLLFGGLEFWRPQRRRGPKTWKRYCFNGGVAAFNTVIVRQLAFVPFLLWLVFVDEQGWGLSRWLRLQGWLEIIASIVVLDAFDYFWHRANHRIAFLWRFHKAHHSDTGMDVSTSLRFHPGELLISALVKAVWLALWGPTAVAWFLFEMLVSLCAQFHHANLILPDWLESLLRPVLVTPRFHATHHLVDRRCGDSNFSTIFPWWDTLFGSTPGAAPALGDDGVFGLPQNRETELSPLEWIQEPIRQRNLGLARDTATSHSR